MASESKSFNQQYPKVDTMNATTVLHGEKRMKDLRCKIAKRVDLANQNKVL